MNTYPKKDAGPQTGSNLRPRNRNALRALRVKLRVERTRIHQRKAREFQRQCKKLFSKADSKIAAGIVANVKNEFGLASFKAGRDVDKRDAIKIAAQKKLNRLLAKALPSFRKFQTLKEVHLREQAALTEAFLSDPATDRLTVRWGDMIVEDPPEFRDFVAPFQIFDSGSDDPDGIIDHGESFANLALSQAANALFFDHDESSSFNPWGLNFNRVHSASSFASCGINFTMPKTGRLQISALLDNIANRCTQTLIDNWGFSSGTLNTRLLLFISVVRGGTTSHLTRTMLANGLVSHGNDMSRNFPVLMNALPYRVTGTTDETYSANESVQILVGTEVQVDSELDDMESKVNALMLWRLRKISVAAI